MEAETAVALVAETPEAEAGVREGVRLGSDATDTIAGYGVRDGFKCRRCRQRIADGTPLNLVPRGLFELPELEPLVTTIGVCDGCLYDDEQPYRGGDLSVLWVVPQPEIHLSPGQLAMLGQIGDGLVYRRPRLIKSMVGKKPSTTDPAVTRMAYSVMAAGLAEWEYVPAASRTESGPSAWAVLTDAGRKFLTERGIVFHDVRQAARGGGSSL